jgi:hypothetical protein
MTNIEEGGMRDGENEVGVGKMPPQLLDGLSTGLRGPTSRGMTTASSSIDNYSISSSLFSRAKYGDIGNRALAEVCSERLARLTLRYPLDENNRSPRHG